MRTSLGVVVLGMLSEESLHAYGMRQRIEERAYDRMPGVKATSLYDVVRRLESVGLISPHETSRAGNRPERTRFAITTAGLNALTDWVQETLADDTDPDSLPAALSFMYPLGRERVIGLLDARMARISAALDADENNLLRAQAEATNPIFLSEHHYQLARRRAERDWLAGFITRLNTGALIWPEQRKKHASI
jgi:DNA-binding PadR family transcriptional regulator